MAPVSPGCNWQGGHCSIIYFVNKYKSNTSVSSSVIIPVIMQPINQPIKWRQGPVTDNWKLSVKNSHTRRKVCIKFCGWKTIWSLLWEFSIKVWCEWTYIIPQFEWCSSSLWKFQVKVCEMDQSSLFFCYSDKSKHETISKKIISWKKGRIGVSLRSNQWFILFRKLLFTNIWSMVSSASLFMRVWAPKQVERLCMEEVKQGHLYNCLLCRI